VATLVVNAAGGRGFWRLPGALRDELERRLPAGWQLAVCDDAAALGPAVRGARAVVGWPFPAALARRAPELRWVHFFTSGVPESWRDAGAIAVTSSAGLNADSVAEHGLFLILAGLRGATVEGLRRWDPEAFAVARAPRDLTAVIFGHGAIGRHLARLLGPVFGTVVSISRTARDGALPFARAAEVVPAADVIVLALPLSEESRALFLPESFFARLRPDVTLVNLARGRLVDEVELLRFLAAHPGSRYLADVAHPEPYPDDGPLRRSPQVLLTPHVAARRADAWRHIGARTLELLGEKLAELS
jgi:phosphoglycerate dehydrogenase-like enzyme